MRFDEMKKGYNRFQVDDALHKAEEEIATLEKKLETCGIQSREDQRKIEHLMEQYQQLSKDLEIKERAAKDMTKIALYEANNIVSNANNNADIIVKEALHSARAILISISKLGVEASEIKQNLNEQLFLLSQAIDDFEVPPIPMLEVDDKYKE